jgi:hypothetical protein
MKLFFSISISALISLTTLAEEISPKNIYQLKFNQETSELYGHFIKNPLAFSLHGDENHQSSHLPSEPNKVVDIVAISNTAAAITQCHMQAMALYPPPLQNIAYQASVDGDNSEQARLKFITAIDKEKQTSTAQQQRLTEIGEQFLQQANHCISQALSGTPLLTHQQ